MTRRSRLRLRAEPRSTRGGIEVADSDISKAAVRWNKPSSQVASNGACQRAPERASDLSRQFRWCFPVSWAAPEALNRHPAHGPRRACPSRMQFSGPSARYGRFSIFANALRLSKLYAILIWGYAPRFTE